MKIEKIIAIVGIVLLGTFLFFACDKIDEDKQREKTASGGGELAGWEGKYVVLEDFTGVRCVNCPKAATAAKAIKDLMGDRLILIELHPSEHSLTKPYSGDSDLTNATAKVYYDYWKVQGLPSGMLNRQQQPGKTSGAPDQWMGLAMAIYKEKPAATMEMTATLSGEAINVSVNGEFKENYTVDGDINLITMVLEDNFSVTQTIQGAPPQKGYIHSHVLRKAVGGDWGVKVLDTKPALGTKISHTTNVDIDAIWKKENLSIVVLLCNSETKEILQAAHAKIK